MASARRQRKVAIHGGRLREVGKFRPSKKDLAFRISRSSMEKSCALSACRDAFFPMTLVYQGHMHEIAQAALRFGWCS